MTATAAENTMAIDDDRKDVPFQIRCSRAWLDRVEEAAKSLSLSAAAYLRMIATQRMNADGVPNPKKKPKK